MPRHSKKGRLAGGARKEINETRATEAVGTVFMTDAERTRKGKKIDFAFGRITKLTGANHVRVAVPAKHGNREVPARIPNIFARRGATPITTRSIVTIYTGEDFDPDAKDLVGTEHFDITSILTDRQVNDLKRAGVIPDWMTAIDATALSSGKAEEDLFVWADADDDGTESKASAVAGDAVSVRRKPDHRAGGGAAAAGAGTDDAEFNIDDI